MDTISTPDRGIRRLQARQIGALPLVEPILTALAVRPTVNELVASEADVDLGQIVVLLVLNRLLTPRPLDGIQDWFAGTVLPEVLGVRVARPTTTGSAGRSTTCLPSWVSCGAASSVVRSRCMTWT